MRGKDMVTTLAHGQRHGSVAIPASKSHVHRLLICASFGSAPTELLCGASEDINATIACLNALGADIRADGEHIYIKPIKTPPTGEVELHCGESGSTLRFLMPIVGALGAHGVFRMRGRLPQRPLAPYDDVLRAHGMEIRRDGNDLYCGGQLRGGDYTLPGDVSSQYISGLLMALPHIKESSTLTVTGRMESYGYIAMTEAALRYCGTEMSHTAQTWHISPMPPCTLLPVCDVDGDWSNAAFYLSMGALSESGITVSNLIPTSTQGDKEILRILREFGADVQEQPGNTVTVRRGDLHGITIDASPIPDLIPTLAVVASVAEGVTVIKNAARLRLKESDRLRSIAMLLNSLGGYVEEQEAGLVIHGQRRLTGGTADAQNDHRIAMSAAVAACVCDRDVTVVGSECVAKSYPRFWHDFSTLTRC